MLLFQIFNNISYSTFDCNWVEQMSSNGYLLIHLGCILNIYNEPCLRFDSNISEEGATNRIFVLVHKLILSCLKKFDLSFGLKTNFCTARYSRIITCNRAHRQGLVNKILIRNIQSITCYCDTDIRIGGIGRSNNKLSDPVIITYVYGVHYNTYDPSYVDQFF